MKKFISRFVKKYLPDIIIIVGIGIFAYNILRPEISIRSSGITRFTRPNSVNTYYENTYYEWEVFGIVLIAIGICIAVRRYFNDKKNKLS